MKAIHMKVEVDRVSGKEFRYLCNQHWKVKPTRITNDEEKVTCGNCNHLLFRKNPLYLKNYINIIKREEAVEEEEEEIVDENETVVVNVNKEPFDVYIGRGSLWGNPFIIGTHGTRDEVIKKYEEYLLKNDDLIVSLKKLKGKRLGCFCAPKKCHGDVLIKYINERY